MRDEELVKELQGKGYIITPEALSIIKNADNPDELVHKALSCMNGNSVIDKSCFDFIEKTKIAETPKKEEEPADFDFNPIGKRIAADVHIVGNEIKDEMKTAGTFDDFVLFFRNRYEKISKMLMTRGSVPYCSLDNLQKKKNQEVKIIVMITEKRSTKNGHIFISGEDPTGKVAILIPQSNKQLISFSEHLMPDEIIAIEGTQKNELYIANEIYQPEVPLKEMTKTEEDIALVLISDMHLGSRLFMKKNFEVFIEWINGRWGSEKQRKLAEKVKYITIAGDNVDGIGIFPGQEKELSTPDIFDQYKLLTFYLKQIPEHIHIILMPGNHDGVKNSDPQPKLPIELIPEIYEMKNVTLIGSPTMVSLHGVKVLMYHGTCFIDLINNLTGSSFDAGAKMMIEMLRRRHVHPFYSGKPITPQTEDTMVIEDVPDIFHCGESHNNSYEQYRGTLCINSGTWQALTDYQIKQGHKATPAIVPVIEMKTGKINVIHFDRDIE